MLIDLRELLSGSQDEKSYKADIEMNTFNTGSSDYDIIDKPAVDVIIKKLGKNKLSIKANSYVTLSIPCDRCLEPVDTRVDYTVDEIVDFNDNASEEEAKEEKDEKAEPAAKPDFASRSDNDPIMREAKEVMDRERNNGTVTTITSGTTIRGGISSDGSLEVMGVITGDVECQGKVSIIGQVSGNVIASEVYVSTQRLEGSLSSEGTVKIGVGTVIIGDIDATSAYIAGAVKGDIDVNGHVEVDSTAIIKGNIKAKSIQVNNGAVVDGYCSLNYAGVNLDDFFDEK